MDKIKFITHENHDAYFNLASEEYLLKRKGGNYVYLWRNAPAVIVGVNQNAARLSGVNVKKYLLFSFAIGGLCAGLSAFMMIVRTGGLTTSTGSYEVGVLIALTIGGMPLTGGSKASIRSAVIGGLALIVLNNILVLLGVKPDFVNVIKGIVFLTLVLVTSRNKAGSTVVG